MSAAKVIINGESYEFQSIRGKDGTTFTPHVSENGELTWTNDGGLENPESVNIRGPEGPPGAGANIEFGDTLIDDDGTLDVKDPVQGIISREEFDLLPKEERERGIWIVPGDGSGSSGGSSGTSEEIYSENETRIGTWIDGKPLYRIAGIGVTANSSSKFETLCKPIQHAELKNIRVMVACNLENNSEYYPISFMGSGSSGRNAVYYSSATGLQVMVASTSMLNSKCEFVIEYTKTTEEAVSK